MAAAIVATLLATGPVAAQAPDVAALCKARSPCALVAATPAGADARGRALTMLELNLGAANPENEGFPCRPYRREFWLRTAGEAEARRVLELCNDGYGAAGVGEDEIRVGDNRLEHAQNGGSAWRWDVTRTVSLSPLGVLRERHCSYHNVAPGFTSTTWDWQRFAGETRWTPKACSEREAGSDAEMGCAPESAKHRYLPVPKLDGAMPAGARLHLGSCATAIDESGRSGYVIHGRPRTDGAELRMLLTSTKDLVVSVIDDSFATGAANWVHDDHVEIWMGQGRTGLECAGDVRANLRQWGIGLDGRVHAGYGDPKDAPKIAARLERRVGPRRQVTLFITLPEDAAGITIVYSKAAAGRQARLTATSAISSSDPTTLGSTWHIPESGARCANRNGQLDLEASGLPALLGVR